MWVVGPLHNPTVRADAIRVIAQKGNEAFLPMLKQRLEVERAFQPRAALLGARSLLGSNDDLRPLLDLLTDADIEQSTIVLNMLWDIIGGPGSLNRSGCRRDPQGPHAGQGA